MLIGFMGYLMDLGTQPTPPPLPGDQEASMKWWNLWTGLPPDRIMQIVLFTAAALILTSTVWEFVRPHVGREPFKVVNPRSQYVRSHRDPGNGYRGIHRR